MASLFFCKKYPSTRRAAEGRKMGEGRLAAAFSQVIAAAGEAFLKGEQ